MRQYEKICVKLEMKRNGEYRKLRIFLTYFNNMNTVKIPTLSKNSLVCNDVIRFKFHRPNLYFMRVVVIIKHGITTADIRLNF